MSQCERIKQILKENTLKQKQFASTIGVSESYISKLLKDPEIRLSQSLATLIEEKYGYNAKWILDGTDPKFKQISKNKSLSEIHQKALLKIYLTPAPAENPPRQRSNGSCRYLLHFSCIPTPSSHDLPEKPA